MSQNLFVNSNYIYNGVSVTPFIDPAATIVWDGHANTSHANASPVPTAGLPPSAFLQSAQPMIFTMQNTGSPNPPPPPHGPAAYAMPNMGPAHTNNPGLPPRNGMFVMMNPPQQQQMVMLVPTAIQPTGNQQTTQSHNMSHNNNNNNTNSAGNNAPTAVSMPVPREGKATEPHNVCRHYMVGRCNRRKCRFLHPALEHTGVPSPSAVTTPLATSVAITDTGMATVGLSLPPSNPSMLSNGFKEIGYDASLNRSSINDISTCSSPMNSKSEMFFSHVPTTVDNVLVDVYNRKV